MMKSIFFTMVLMLLSTQAFSESSSARATLSVYSSVEFKNLSDKTTLLTLKSNQNIVIIQNDKGQNLNSKDKGSIALPNSSSVIEVIF